SAWGPKEAGRMLWSPPWTRQPRASRNEPISEPPSPLEPVTRAVFRPATAPERTGRASASSRRVAKPARHGADEDVEPQDDPDRESELERAEHEDDRRGRGPIGVEAVVLEEDRRGRRRDEGENRGRPDEGPENAAGKETEGDDRDCDQDDVAGRGLRVPVREHERCPDHGSGRDEQPEDDDSDGDVPS